MAPRGRPKKHVACRTCKIRRIKCDETRPQCIRCTSTGRKCDGYTSLNDSISSIKLFATSQELRSFRYFCEKTSLEITSYYDESFWQSLVVQLSHVNPGLGHLVVAIGSLHESLKDPQSTFANPNPSSAQLAFSLRQCNKAIAMLTQPKSKSPELGVIIASCVLIVAFEMLQNQLDAALKQFRIGTRLLELWRSHSSRMVSASERDLIDNILSPILNRFGESLGFGPNSQSKPDQGTNPLSNNLSEDRPYTVPTVFVTLGSARTSLHNALDFIFEELRHSTADISTDRNIFYNRLRPVLDTWHTRFQQFVDTLKSGLSSSNKRRICLVNMQYFIGGISFAACVFKDEMVYDNYLNDFQKIVELCTDIIEIETGDCFKGKVPYMSFSFDLGILMPLYFTTWRCRDPCIRRQALHLLQNCPRREGIFLSWVTGMVSEQIINIEEEGLRVDSCKDLSIGHRIQSMHMHYDPGPVNVRDPQTLYQPVLRFSWVKYDPVVDKAPVVKHKHFRLPSTSDATLGTHPYWVVMPSIEEISSWKLLMARKVFKEPDFALETTNNQLGVGAESRSVDD